VAKLEISDTTIWTNHIHGDKPLQDRLNGLNEGDPVVLRIDGELVDAVKMRDGVTPTPGVRLVGKAKGWWKAEMFPNRKGELVSIELVAPVGKPENVGKPVDERFASPPAKSANFVNPSPGIRFRAARPRG
jgi:hypothetical protein